MKKIYIILMMICFLITNQVKSQDTFSIVALDPGTGEVGSAGASCVDLIDYPTYPADFLGELFPGLGAINTQAWYLAANQANARNRMNLGDTPSEIIEWLVANDAQNQPGKRQYGIVAFVDGEPESAAHTGESTDDYKNHILGYNYAMQGNILRGPEVLDSMKSYFENAQGDLACQLMAALQGAKMIGADERCTSNGTSALFAFIKVAQPDDVFGNPSFVLTVKTAENAGIEPIDSLQVLFDEVHYCPTLVIDESDSFNDESFSIYPNPSNQNLILINSNIILNNNSDILIFDIAGNAIYKSRYHNNMEIDISVYSKGMYIINISNEKESYTSKFRVSLKTWGLSKEFL